MAKINTTFSLADNVSSPLRNIVQNLKNTSESVSNLSESIFAANQSLQLFSGAINAVRNVGNFFGGFIKEAGETQMLISRLTVAFGNSATAVEKFKEIQDFAAATPFDVQGTTQSYIMLKNAGMETKKLLPTIRMIGDLAQGNNLAFNNMALNMMQIQASGKATAMDLKQFSTFGVPVVQALKEIGREGDNSFDAIYQAMIHLTSEGGKFYNSMEMGAQSLQGRVSNLQDSVQRLKSAVGDAFLPMVQNLVGNLSVKIDSLTISFQKLRDNVNDLRQKMSVLSPVFQKLSPVFNLIIKPMLILIGTMAATSVAFMGFKLIVVSTTSIVARSVVTMTRTITTALVSMPFIGWAVGVASAISLIVIALNRVKGGVKDLSLMNEQQLLREQALAQARVASHQLEANKWQAEAAGYSRMLDEATNEMDRSGYKIKLQSAAAQRELALQRKTVAEDELNSVNKQLEAYRKLSTIDEEQFKFDSGGALKVSDDSLKDMSEDFKELLGKRAAEKFNLQFSQIAPSVNVQNISITESSDYESAANDMVAALQNVVSANLLS